MKWALVDGERVEAETGPRWAACPACGEPVERRRGSGSWHWRHAPGHGADCERRVKPLRPARQRPAEADPYRRIALDSAEQAVRQARRGDALAILAIAFSPVVRGALDLVGVAPEQVLDGLAQRGGEVVECGDDEALALALARKAPAPVVDLRCWHNGHIDELEALGLYVSLPALGPADLQMVRRVAPLVERVYVLGEWDGLTAGT